MKPWIIYTRVSTDDQAAEGHNLGMQEAACRAMLSATGTHTPTLVCDDGYSAASLERPGIEQIIADSQAGKIAGICVWKLDRLSRSLRDLLAVVETFDRHGVALVSVTERIDTTGPLGKFTLSLLGTLAQLERDQISHRTKSAMAHMKALGHFTGGPVAPSLCVIDRRLVADPLRAPVIVEAFRLIVEGGSLRAAGRHLGAAGLYNGGEQKPSTVASLVRNRRYVECGVVTQEQFDAVATALGGRWCAQRPEGRITRGHRPSDFVWPLHGLGHCSRCGRALVGASAKGRKNAEGNARAYRYLRCCGRGAKKCNAPDLPADAWEGAVAQLLAVSIKDGSFGKAYSEYAAKMQQETAPLAGQRNVVRQERDSAAARLDRLIDQVADGTLTGAAAKERIAALQGEVDRLQAEMGKIDGKLAAADTLDQGRAAIEEALERAADRLPTADPATLQTIFAGLIASVVMDSDAKSLVVKLHSPTPCGVGSYSLTEWVP